jgi:hypothetical protein
MSGIMVRDNTSPMKPFHEMTRAEITEELRALYHAQPKAEWERLLVGNIILYRYRAWRIARIPPKRGFVWAENLATGDTEKLLRSRYDGKDLLVAESDETISTLSTVHRAEIRKAMAAGIAISPLVQYDYPEVFTPYPEEWDERLCEEARATWARINELRTYRDHHGPPGWQFGDVDSRIEDAQKAISSWKTYRAECHAGVRITSPEAIPDIVRRVDETIVQLREEIVILLYLRKHLENTIPREAGAASG